MHRLIVQGGSWSTFLRCDIPTFLPILLSLKIETRVQAAKQL